MLLPSRRACTWSAAAALLLAALLAAFRAVRSESGAAPWDELLAVAGLTWAGLLAAAWAVERRHRRALSRLADTLAAFRKHPSARPLDAEELEEFPAPLADQLAALCASHHKAVADLVGGQATIEELRAQLGRGDGDKGPNRTVIQRGSGSSRNMVARLTPNLFWMAATPALQQFLGARLADLNGRPFAENVLAEDFAPLRRIFREALETGEAHNITFRLHTRPAAKGSDGRQGLAPEPAENERHGGERHVQMDVLTRYGDDGTPLHFRCFLIDITDRLRAEQELRRRSEELTRTNDRLLRINRDLERLKESYFDLYHHAPVMYFSLDADGRLVACNETLLQALGYAREELIQQPYTRLLPSESRERYRENAAAYQRQGEVETRWLKHDGTVIDVWIRSVPLQDAEGRFVRSRSVAQDVTERNRLANELRHRRDELERANVDLRQINKELDEFNSIVSHDLRAGLLTIDATSNALAQEYSTQLGADGFEYVNHLLKASRRLRRMIEELRTLSRAGRITTAPRAFDLMEVFATVRADLGTTIRDRKATVLTEGALPCVLGDPERIAQLLSNLIANGLKYNTNPAPRVVLGELRPAARNGAGGDGDADFVTLYVRDNGIGIDPLHHKHVFEPFRRLHREGEYEGTGAGLTICRRVVEAHKGRIWVESEAGKGAAFYFTLPRAAPAAKAAPREALNGDGKDGVNGAVAPAAPAPDPRTAPGASPPAKASDRRPAPTGSRLLLVEDMESIGVIVQRLTKHAGHTLKWVTTAEDAWEYLQDNRPELVLLDIHLPRMDGIELCRRLRADPKQAGLHIALFSGGADSADLQAGLQAGANCVLSKELLCQPDAWRRHVQDILGQLAIVK
jgi:PAS domain S-box-containing protein